MKFTASIASFVNDHSGVNGTDSISRLHFLYMEPKNGIPISTRGGDSHFAPIGGNHQNGKQELRRYQD